VLGRLIRLVSIVASLLVVAGWGLFAIDEARSASSATTQEIRGRAAAATSDPSPDQERAREAIHAKPREAIDDANDVLLAPFASVGSGSSDRWVRRSVPAALALLVYGLGLSFLARYAAGRD
jgi:hypothetical protein